MIEACDPGTTPTGYRPIQFVEEDSAEVVWYETVSGCPAATVVPAGAIELPGPEPDPEPEEPVN